MHPRNFRAEDSISTNFLIYFPPPPFDRDRPLEQIYNEISSLKSADLPELSDRVRDFNRSCEHHFADINSAVVAKTPYSVNKNQMKNQGWKAAEQRLSVNRTINKIFSAVKKLSSQCSTISERVEELRKKLTKQQNSFNRKFESIAADLAWINLKITRSINRRVY